MISSFAINNRPIGPTHPCYIIAEMSANHGQNFDRAIRLIEAAKKAGADAVKLQTYTPDTLTIRCESGPFRIGGGTLWDGQTLHDLYQKAFMPWEWQPRLMEAARQIGIELFSTPFDPTAVDFLESMGVSVQKIASFELVDLPLIEKVARTGKPLIMSTGMASIREIDEAMTTARNAGAVQIALLKCTSAYPAPAVEMNLLTIPHLRDLYRTPVGLSDHTPGSTVAIAATVLGASIIEKHFTLSRSVPGPDSAFSMEPPELKAMVTDIRTAEQALGIPCYGPSGAEERKSLAFRRSLFVVKPIKAGEVFSHENIRSIRPSHGLPPRHLAHVIGKTALKDLDTGTPLAWHLISS